MSIMPDGPILKISVMADGRISVDGSTTTIDSLRDSLKQLAEQKGVVWYYREASQSKAPQEATEVIQAVIENRLPVRLSSRPDFSDAIGPDGKPIVSGTTS
jgi:biopolymer transport protein ExbD